MFIGWKKVLAILLAFTILNCNAFVTFPQELPRSKGSMRTVCMKIRPSSPEEEPYYMCKGSDIPMVEKHMKSLPSLMPQSEIINEPNGVFNDERDKRFVKQLMHRSINEREVSTGYNPTARPEQFAPLAHPEQQASISPQFLLPAFQIAREPMSTIQVHAPVVNIPREEERSPQGFLYQDPVPNQFTRQQFNTQPTGFIYSESLPDIRGQQYGLPLSVQENEPHVFIPLDRQSTETPAFGFSSAGTRFPNERLESGTGLSYGPHAADRSYFHKQFSQPNSMDQIQFVDTSYFNTPTRNVRPYTAKTATGGRIAHTQPTTHLDSQNYYQPRNIPNEYMDDPILNAFYTSLYDTNLFPRTPDNILIPEALPKPAVGKPQQQHIEESTDTETKFAESCAPCHKNQNEPKESISSLSNPTCLTQRTENVPPLVIAMPCLNLPTTQAPYNPYTLAPAYFGFFPSYLPPFMPGPLDHTNYAKILAATNAEFETTTPLTTTSPNTSTTPDSTILGSAAQTSNDKMEEVTLSTPIKLESSTEGKSQTVDNENVNETSTALETTEETVGVMLTESQDELQSKEESAKTFTAMFNRAKAYKELADNDAEPVTISSNKKTKRQHAKVANAAALRTIAEAVKSAQNKRKFTSMPRS